MNSPVVSVALEVRIPGKEGTTVIIRNAVLEDCEVLVRIRLEYLATDFGEMSEGTNRMVSEQLLPYFQANLGRTFHAVLAEIDGNVVSTAYLALSERPANPSCPSGKIGTVLNVLTLPEHRRKGISTTVLSTLIEFSRTLGLSYLELSASEAGIGIYRRLGFEETTPSRFMPMRLQLIHTS
jgi:GNAT superfamily N-acetyltransferase